jgi:DNA segregation ATPase FtsK/SpoIIIE, S-DNA-T family
LIFAALGPITAVASLLDSHVGARRITRRELVRFHRDADAVQREIEAHHADEGARYRARYPPGPDLSDRRGGDPHRWTTSGDDAILVNLGRGESSSAISLDAILAGAVHAPDVTARLAELSKFAHRATDAPLLVDARLGIGISGSAAVTLAAARSLLVQLARSLNPSQFAVEISAPAQELDWIGSLPHPRQVVRSERNIVAHFKRIADDGVVATVATSNEVSSLPGNCRIAVRIDSRLGAKVVHHPDPEVCGDAELALVSRGQATIWALHASEIAIRDGLVVAAARLPSRIDLADLASMESVGESGSPLLAEFLVDESGAIGIDLVRDGPHAVVGGSTGSGKSELLISWVVSLAASYSPEAVNFLLVDFKGGAAFASLDTLPHTVGIITDLDEAEAARALESLRAELRYRERVLASAGVRDISAAEAVPRLVIVIDEFATVIERHAELHGLFNDIAARGRSLGVHLILCTQRPGVTVRDAVLANADLRISLRVNNRNDSLSVVGSDAAATLDPVSKGRAILGRPGEEPKEVQVAVASESDVRAAADRWSAAAQPRRPWCEALPRMLTREALAIASAAIRGAAMTPSRHSIDFGLLDQPQHQGRAVAVYSPMDDGNLLIVGGPGSGKSTLLRVFSGFAHAWLMPRSADAAWDSVAGIVEQLGARETPGGASAATQLILIDDIDSLLMRFSQDHRSEFIARLSRVLRDGVATGLSVAMTSRRISSDVQPLAALVANSLPLAPTSRQDLTLLGLDSAQFIPDLPPGGGVWRGDRVQVLYEELLVESNVPAIEGALATDRPLAVVSGNSVSTLERLRALGCSVLPLAGTVGDPRDVAVSRGAVWTAIVGDAEEWQSRWGALSSIRPIADIMFHHCSVAEYRALTRSRELPPPLGDESALFWRWRADGRVDRVRLVVRGGENRPEP